MQLKPNDGRITPECVFALVFARLIAYRRTHGPAKCRRNGIGAVRKVIGEALPPGIAMASPLLEGQRQAARVVEAECRRCGLCKLGQN